MYYSVNQPPQSISQQSNLLNQNDYEPVIRYKKRRLYVFVAMTIIAIVTISGGVAWWHEDIKNTLQEKSKITQLPSKQTPEVKPEVAGVTFGDLINQKRSYAGWIAGAVEGNIVILNPQSGEINSLTSTESEWHGPISPLVWSPDRTKLAYLVLPEEEASGFQSNPTAQAQKMGLESVPTPQSFPFGKAVILDINTKQVLQTGMEVRNTPKNVIWLDDNRLAAITTSISVFDITKQTISTVAGAGITDAESQLQSPLEWNPETETLYFTKVKKIVDQGMRIAVQVSLATNEAKELTTLRVGAFEDVSVSRGVGLALDEKSERLAFINQNGIAYQSLADGGIHALPPQDDWLWLKDSIISDVEWLSPSRIAFVSMSDVGSKVWVVWDIPGSKLITFGRGFKAGSWDKATGQLALIRSTEDGLQILTPNWNDPLKSTLEDFNVSWQSLTW